MGEKVNFKFTISFICCKLKQCVAILPGFRSEFNVVVSDINDKNTTFIIKHKISIWIKDNSTIANSSEVSTTLTENLLLEMQKVSWRTFTWRHTFDGSH